MRFSVEPRRKSSEPDSSTLRVGMLGGWSGLDPWEAQDLATVVVRNQCFETLYHWRGAELRADRRYLAHPLRMSTMGAGGLPNYSARLVEDIKFCDGRSMTPEHVASSLSRVAPLRGKVTVNAAGGRRVQFVCEEADVVLEPQLAQIWSVIGRRGPNSWLGTGPYMIVEEHHREVGHVLTLERNPHWNPGAGKAPSIERITFHSYPVDAKGVPTALRAAVEAGEVDFTLMLPREVAKGLQGVRKIYQPGQSTAFLAFGCKRPWLDRPEVRRALSAAIDPWAVAGVCHDNPAAFAARGLLPPAMAPSRRSLPRYGTAVAAEALSALGGRAPKLRMLTVWGPRPYLPKPRAVAKLIVSQFAAVGVAVEVEQARNADEFFKAVRAGEHDLILTGYIAETPDPVEFLAAQLSSTRVPRRGAPMASTTNMGHFVDAEMDKLLSAAQRDPTQIDAVNARFELMRPVVPLMYGASVVVHSWRVQHFELDPRGIPSFAELSLG